MSTAVALTDAEFADLFRTFTRSAFRCEQQPTYRVPGETDTVGRFLSGDPQDPTELPEFRDWYQTIRDQTAAGRTVERVRIHDDPPTDYQRWVRWVGRWNEQAGEVIHYVTRPEAAQAGFLPADPGRDWWLFDDRRLAVLDWDTTGHLIGRLLITDDEQVAQARAWRHLAVRHTRKGNTVEQPTH